MKRLFLLVLVCAAGYLAYTGEYRFVLDYLRPEKESDVPAEYRGKYVADVEANQRYIRQNNSFSASVKKKLSEIMVGERLQIRRSSMVGATPAGDNKRAFGVEVIEKGPNWIVIQNTSDLGRDGAPIITRITRDATGVWFSTDKPLKGFKQRFTKLN